MNFSEYKGVLVFIEQREGIVQNVSLELLGKGREIADNLGEELIAVVLGHKIGDIALEVGRYGADKVVAVDNEDLKIYTTEPYTQALTAVINDKKPDIVLVGATSIGRDLGPRVSARVKTGLTADCTKLEVSDERQLMMTRPAFGGNIMATIICPDHRPQMSTVRPGVMQKLQRDDAKLIEVETMNVDFKTEKFKVKV
ncbi:MAG: electron transfer flavoprotein subunit alpha/FixB family protein, partial [Acidaminobacteraceae bacterium]